VKVRAVAIATERSNAIGTVELECTPHGLVLVYLGVGSFSEGYTPGALTSGTSVMVPWASVREARLEGERLYLALDSPASPHSRLDLVNFSAGDLPDPREVYRQRLVLRVATGGTMLVSVLVVILTMQRLAPHQGALTTLAVGAVAALAVLSIGLLADRRATQGGADSDSVREAFAGELSVYLPSLLRGPRPPRPARRLPALPSLQGALPRTTLAIVITLTAATLGAILMGRWIISGEPEARRAAERPRRHRVAEPPDTEPVAPPLNPPARANQVALLPAQSSHVSAPAPPSRREPAPSGDVASVVGDCQCVRGDSALWADPIPKLSTLLLAKRSRRSGRHTELEVDIAAVNNSDVALRELTLVIEFYEQDPPPSLKRYSVGARSVYYQGPLGPGEAIKWTVEARGTDFEVRSPIEGNLGSHGEGAAPTNLLAQLLDANHRPVRLHGAMMLAFLGDPRAREAALHLREALREAEAPYLDRLIAATGEIRVCGLEVGEPEPQRPVHACLFNASSEPRGNLALRVRGLDARVSHATPVEPPPLVVSEATWKLPGALAAGRGVQVVAQMSTAGSTEQQPAMFEAVAERLDLLR
jgi:hypothetical protein